MPDWFQQFLSSDEMVAAVIAVLLAALIEIIQRFFAPRGRVRWAVAHEFAYEVRQTQGQALLIRTRHIWIQNVGRAPVKNLEVVLNYRPEHYEVWPQRAYSEDTNPEKRLVVNVASLAAREFFTIGMISATQELPAVMNVRSSDGMGRPVLMGPTQIQPRWVLEMLRFLLFLGAFSLIYWAVRIIQFF
ncbi:hypothetical protein AUC69_03480 [Methyloceanibacter superfactus]|uniref:Uncharacterized protein n=1 Tax=Methyloceanibacter superfactus TaxID=1774969 RepID=A0A1E3VL41_9HYPH|nr:hypothetical protein [Methyloceanibacter superfactus]ODR94222.1 hypothetical protein AUC69_03480 [Methyloceanibacter superfactus]